MLEASLLFLQRIRIPQGSRQCCAIDRLASHDTESEGEGADLLPSPKEKLQPEHQGRRGLGRAPKARMYSGVYPKEKASYRSVDGGGREYEGRKTSDGSSRPQGSPNAVEAVPASPRPTSCQLSSFSSLMDREAPPTPTTLPPTTSSSVESRACVSTEQPSHFPE